LRNKAKISLFCIFANKFYTFRTSPCLSLASGCVIFVRERTLLIEQCSPACRVSDNGLPDNYTFPAAKLLPRSRGRSFHALAVASGGTHMHDGTFDSLKSRHFLESFSRYALLITVIDNLTTLLASRFPFRVR